MARLGRAVSRAARSAYRPTRMVPLGFLAAIAVGTVLLMLPVSSASGQGAPLRTAAFTSTSATCVTGLTVVDTATYWSGFGLAVLLLLVQIGGLGIMTGATLLALLVSRQLGVRSRLIAETESQAISFGNARLVLRRVAVLFLAFEAAGAVLLAARFFLGYDYPFGKAVWFGVFHSVSAFNNAGFALYKDSLVRFVHDPFVCLVVAIAVFIGGLGFPVLIELRRVRWHATRWSVLTRLTVWTSLLLLVLGTGAYLLFEGNNESTLGPLTGPGKVLTAFFASVMTRSGGLNTIDISRLTPDSLLATDGLMFIGAGSAGTSGGIKVTTFALLAFVMLAEIRGEPDVTVGRRRVSTAVQRQAMTVSLLAVGIVASATLLLEHQDGFGIDRTLFEVVSAFGTTGLSTGITNQLSASGQWTLVLLMFIGRVGTITAAAALALHTRTRLYRLPEERVIVG